MTWRDAFLFLLGFFSSLAALGVVYHATKPTGGAWVWVEPVTSFSQ